MSAIHPEARLDLRESIDFIAEDSPADADRVLTDILESLASLARFPAPGTPPS